MSLGVVDSLNQFYFFKLGNADDRLEFYQNDRLKEVGDNQEFNTSKETLEVFLGFHSDSLTINLLRTNDTHHWEHDFKLKAPVKSLRWSIEQYGKTAINAHKIMSLCWLNQPEKIEIVDCNLIQQNEVLVRFNHGIIKPSEQDISINEHPVKEVFIGRHSREISFTFEPLETDTQLNIDIQVVPINSGKKANESFQLPFQYLHEPQWGDVMLSEVLFDVNPSYVHTPLVEFIEIYNSSQKLLELSGSIIEINQNKWTIPKCYITPYSYQAFSKNTHTHWDSLPGIKSSTFPNLLSTSNTIVLYNKNGEVLDKALCSSDQQSSIYREGGNSLSRANLEAPLTNPENWTSSQRCSPHDHNSNYNQKPTRTKTPIDGAYYYYDSIALSLNTELKPDQFIKLIHPNKVDSFFYLNGIFFKIPLLWSRDNNIKIKVQLRNGKHDTLSTQISKIGNSQLKITEILFEHSQGIDFLELYNPGPKALLLEDIDLLVYNEESNLTDIIHLKNSRKDVVYPGEILVITQNCYQLNYRYGNDHEYHCVGIDRFPNLRSSGGYIEIVHHIYGRIERVPFSKDMHSQLYTKNLSLERKSIELNGSFSTNWHSHLPSNEEASPGTIMQNQERENDHNDFIHLPKRVWINPNENTLTFNYSFPENDFVVHAYLFTAWSKPLHSIMDRVLLPTEGTFITPLTKSNTFLPAGNYILKFEAVNLRTLERLNQIERITIKY